jgi:hypothetical protein
MQTSASVKSRMSVVIILLLICTTVSPSPPSRGVTASVPRFMDGSVSGSVQNITLADDAFHGTTTFFHIESWYFDAVLEQNYSIALVVTIVQRGTIGFALIGLYLYNDTNLVAHPRKLVPLKDCLVSTERPLIKFGNSTIIAGTLNESIGWSYHVALQMDGQGIDLQFTNLTKGWKTDIPGGWWLVIPNLRVTGQITLNGTTIAVSGEGYHDHNWFYPYTPLIQKGWQFINAPGDTLGITMVKVMKNRLVGESMTILNQKDRNPLVLPSDEVHFLVTDYIVDHGRVIPSKFLLQVSSVQVQANLTIETRNVHFIRLPFLNYWRYHLHITGTITVGSVTEKIDTTRISELLRFF